MVKGPGGSLLFLETLGLMRRLRRAEMQRVMTTINQVSMFLFFPVLGKEKVTNSQIFMLVRLFE